MTITIRKVSVKIIIIICYICIALFWVLKALYMEGGISSTTTVRIHLDDANGSHVAPERPPNTSLLVERRQYIFKLLFHFLKGCCTNIKSTNKDGNYGKMRIVYIIITIVFTEKLKFIFMVAALIISISFVLKLLQMNPELTVSNLVGELKTILF